MPLFTEGHLGWALFGMVVFSLLSLLVVDFVWRMVRVRAFVLLPLALGVWGVGVLLGIWALGFG